MWFSRSGHSPCNLFFSRYASVMTVAFLKVRAERGCGSSSSSGDDGEICDELNSVRCAKDEHGIDSEGKPHRTRFD